MIVFQKRIQLKTHGHGHIQNLTETIGRIIEESNIRDGTVTVFNVGSTGAVGTLEYEPGLIEDLAETLDRIIPPGRGYAHEATWADGNAHSHLQATLLGPSLTIPVSKGRMVLGTWQQVIHVECDVRPRNREIVITVVGAKE